jgi:hypothetical protein
LSEGPYWRRVPVRRAFRLLSMSFVCIANWLSGRGDGFARSQKSASKPKQTRKDNGQDAFHMFPFGIYVCRTRCRDLLYRRNTLTDMSTVHGTGLLQLTAVPATAYRDREQWAGDIPVPGTSVRRTLDRPIIIDFYRLFPFVFILATVLRSLGLTDLGLRSGARNSASDPGLRPRC